MPRSRSLSVTLAGSLLIVLAVIVASCGSSATPAPATQAPGATAAGGGGGGGGGGAGSSVDLGGLFGSLGLGSFGLNFHGAPDLEAVLPSQACGGGTLKLSFGGDTFGLAGAAADPMFGQILGSSGKTAADVSFAVATPTGSTDGCATSFSAFRIAGVDATAFQGFFMAMEQQDGTTATQISLAGKSVIKADTTYTYFKGDTMFAVDADTDDAAAAGLALLP